eukprot:TRINITY_DN17638_c0_g2_i1.p1 TRINITY_DN17638_c0_g2~~TRINITY_DN17638_c0_g2_i1.p1  ORF type:complete len:665 (+),score=148.59 TRINITY_DN17638_c0_g2_i1:45-2039(+)
MTCFTECMKKARVILGQFSTAGTPDSTCLDAFEHAWLKVVGERTTVTADEAHLFCGTLVNAGWTEFKLKGPKLAKLEHLKALADGIPLEVFAQFLIDPNFTAVQYLPKGKDEVWITIGNTAFKADDDVIWTLFVVPEKDFIQSVTFKLPGKPDMKVTSSPWEIVQRSQLPVSTPSQGTQADVEVTLKNTAVKNFKYMVNTSKRAETTSIIACSPMNTSSITVLPSHSHWLDQGGSGDMITKPATSSAGAKGLSLHTIDWSKNEGRAAELIAALKSDGFVYITNHGVKRSQIQETMSLAKNFFSTQAHYKAAVMARPRMEHHQPIMKCARGYTPMRMENLNPFMGGDLKESFDYGAHSLSTHEAQLGLNRWPPEDIYPGLRVSCEEYLYQVRKLAESVLEEISKGLGLEDNTLLDCFDKPLVINRVLRYSPQKEATPGKNEIGAGSHVDYGALTLITQDNEGLEVMRDGEWVAIPVVPGSFVLNTGFVLEKLTNGVLPATMHRVINKHDGDRYSIATFYDPSPQSVITPLQPFVGDAPPRYASCIAGHKGIIVDIKEGIFAACKKAQEMQQHYHHHHHYPHQPQHQQYHQIPHHQHNQDHLSQPSIWPPQHQQYHHHHQHNQDHLSQPSIWPPQHQQYHHHHQHNQDHLSQPEPLWPPQQIPTKK